jgi:tetratricopeptide (TPR) repeat protein
MRVGLHVLLFLALPTLAFSETIVLKTGKTVEGKILEQTDKSIKVDLNGILMTYRLADIESIDAKPVIPAELSSEQKPLSSVPSSAEEYFENGFNYIQQSNFSQAISDFTKAVGLDPNYADAYCLRGLAYTQQSNLPQAISDFTKAIELNPNLEEAYYNRGVAYFHQKDFDKAWQDIHKAESLGAVADPEFLEALKKSSGKEK